MFYQLFSVVSELAANELGDLFDRVVVAGRTWAACWVFPAAPGVIFDTSILFVDDAQADPPSGRSLLVGLRIRAAMSAPSIGAQVVDDALRARSCWSVDLGEVVAEQVRDDERFRRSVPLERVV